MKKVILATIIVLSFSNVFAQASARASGLFFAVATGGRLPVGDFSQTSEFGIGINLELSYTDSEYIPFFVYAKIGYESYPGSQDYYRETNIASYSTNSLPVNVGLRYFLPPLLKETVLIYPVAEVGGAFAYNEIYIEHNADLGLNNQLIDESKFGVQAGLGVSMFLMELMGYYNYFPENEFVSFDLKIRIPIFVQF